MKLINPNYSDTAAETFITNNTAKIQTYLSNNSDKAEIDFDKVRADNPAMAAKLTDGMLSDICQRLGIVVV